MFVGIDTSNYTTSVAALEGEEFSNIRAVLPVKEGERGIRQSEALFMHTKSIGELFERLRLKEIKAVGVSVRPRNIEGSYMPVFLAGEAFARGVAHTAGVPLYKFSHQDGHIMAGIFSGQAKELMDGEFLSVHLSGGTTEILLTQFNGFGFDNKILGGTKDISAGQFIDRIGVRMGLKFPCGKELEQIAYKADKGISLPITERGGYLHFSGVETKAGKLLENSEFPQIARGVIENIAYSLSRAINSVIDKTGVTRVLVVGGVASNSMIRDIFNNNVNARMFFGSAQLSTDNAVGIACLARAGYEEEAKWSRE